MKISTFIGIAALTAAGYAPFLAQATACTGRGIELQVLGSGGPELIGDRASTSYLLWRDGRASVLVDSGGGSALRFGAAGAKVQDLDLVLFTHLHVDHSADFPALVKSSYFQHRQRPLPVFGPVGNAAFPSTTAFLKILFGRAGTYRYLSDYLPTGKAAKGAYALQPRDVKPATGITTAFNVEGIKASAISVEHGNVPALAWRVDLGEHSVAFSGDTSGKGEALTKLAKDADIFVAHNAVPQSAEGEILDLHMPPSVIGRIAASANPKRLVLSHRMARTLGQEDETKAQITRQYSGSISFADDLDCYAIAAVAN